VGGRRPGRVRPRAPGAHRPVHGAVPGGLPDHKVNGALTVGENIGDLGGLTIALKAYKIALGDAEAPRSTAQRLPARLLRWAQIWRIVTREAEAIRRLTIDPHSPPDLRCNAVVTNLDAFHEAFDVHPGDALYTAPEHRVRIW
jgi:putative endopeptidase